MYGLILSTTPAARLTFLSSIGLLVAASIVFWALQPANGPTLMPSQWRLPGALPIGFWVSWAVGLCAWLVSAWVYSLRPTEPSVILFAASGFMTLVFTFASTPSMVAMPVSDLVTSLGVTLNALGASGFGIAMICLFIIYPSHLPKALWLCATFVIAFGGWTISILVGEGAKPENIQLITLIEMLVIMGLSLWQVLRTHPDPAHRAIAIWLGVSVLFGAGPFIGLVALPLTFGYTNLINENLAFGSFILIYIGLALGLLRYRLFDLGTWAYGLLFYAIAACAVLVLDIALISFVAMTPGTAFATTLIIVAFVWLPLRDLVWQRFTGQSANTAAQAFAAVARAVLQPTTQLRVAGWRDVLQDLFKPLEIFEDSHGATSVQLGVDGIVLHVPAIMDGPALTLRHAKSGEALFSRRDCDLAQQFVVSARQIDLSRDAYDRGTRTERGRIARDLHDDVSSRLLTSLHRTEPDRVQADVREALSDIRSIISGLEGDRQPISDVLSAIRIEALDRFEAAGIEAAWPLDANALPDQFPLDYRIYRNLNAVMREITSNIIRHANATRVQVVTTLTAGEAGLVCTVDVTDDGIGLDVDHRKGSGLTNIVARMTEIGGRATFNARELGCEAIPPKSCSVKNGMRVSLEFPISPL